MHKLEYFKLGNAICADDFKNKPQAEYINLQQISSYSNIKRFTTPLSDRYVDDYAIVSMLNGDRFYINKEEYLKLMEAVL